MNIQWIGPAAAAATFCGVWLGHVLVRRLEHRLSSLWPARLGFAALGAACLVTSIYLGGQAAAATTEGGGPSAAAAATGILGLLFLYDIVELARQERRVLAGRAIANAGNPRHRPAFDSGLALARDPFAEDPPIPDYKDRA